MSVVAPHVDGEGVPPKRMGLLRRVSVTYTMRQQQLLDKATPFLWSRWLASLLLGLAFGTRVFLLQGWYIVTYALGIYLLNLFIGFLSPQKDPDTEGPVLPTKRDDEFRPFVRRLPEFKFWYSATRAIILAFTCTFFSAFNIPVFWPILLVYFFALFFMTMRRQIGHMIRYKYIPFTYGKQKYTRKGESTKDEKKEAKD